MTFCPHLLFGQPAVQHRQLVASSILCQLPLIPTTRSRVIDFSSAQQVPHLPTSPRTHPPVSHTQATNKGVPHKRLAKRLSSRRLSLKPQGKCAAQSYLRSRAAAARHLQPRRRRHRVGLSVSCCSRARHPPVTIALSIRGLEVRASWWQAGVATPYPRSLRDRDAARSPSSLDRRLFHPSALPLLPCLSAPDDGGGRRGGGGGGTVTKCTPAPVVRDENNQACPPLLPLHSPYNGLGACACPADPRPALVPSPPPPPRPRPPSWAGAKPACGLLVPWLRCAAPVLPRMYPLFHSLRAGVVLLPGPWLQLLGPSGAPPGHARAGVEPVGRSEPVDPAHRMCPAARTYACWVARTPPSLGMIAYSAAPTPNTPTPVETQPVTYELYVQPSYSLVTLQGSPLPLGRQAQGQGPGNNNVRRE